MDNQSDNQLLTSWGNFPKIVTEVKNASEDDWNALEDALNLACRGNGRAYGDCALNTRLVYASMQLKRFESFDPESGGLVAQSGVLLSEILDVFMPKGFFLSVTPGTKFASLGGAVASDVHGKDHHVTGTFSSHVLFIDIYTSEQGLVRASRTEHPDLFFATIGGMGLTGFIVRVALQLKPISSTFIQQTTYKCGSLSEIMQLFEGQQDMPYSVAWIDCLNGGSKSLGRSLFMAGDFAPQSALPAHYRSQPKATFESEQEDSRQTKAYHDRVIHPLYYRQPHPKSVPFMFPSWVLNNISMRTFNSFYYHKSLRERSKSLVTTDKFFYPLDAILNWNRIYGARGFTQYQFVVPKDNAEAVITSILKQITKSHKGSFLSVLKLFGEHNHPNYGHFGLQNDNQHQASQGYDREEGGYLSFPMAGYTLALDFAIEPDLFSLLTRLDDEVAEAGGRIYLTKDVRLSESHFRAMYGSGVDKFMAIKQRYDPHNKFTSMQAQRLGLVF